MSFHRHADYRPSGVEWLGDIPAHWRVTRLKHAVIKMYSGGTPDSGNPEFWATQPSDAIPWVNIADVTRSAIIEQTEKCITRRGLESKGLDVVPTLDALIADARRAIELLEERRTALISAAVTGQIDVRRATELQLA
jgi:type I restriction enzyme S subunit